MESEKYNNDSNDTFTAGSDQKPTEDSSASTSAGGAVIGRSYDCAFCKRGFTNAQALGGHMNIHRRDKAKAKVKQKNQNFKLRGNCKNLSCFSPVSSGGYVDYQVCFPTSNRNIQTGDYFPVWRGDYLKDDKMEGLFPRVEDEGEVDLELRLGQYPLYKM